MSLDALREKSNIEEVEQVEDDLFLVREKDGDVYYVDGKGRFMGTEECHRATS